MITKGSLINGAYSLMRISGLTVDPTPEDMTAGLQVADDYAAQLKEDGLDLQWLQPVNYGQSDPSDTSNLTQGMAGPFKKLLVRELVSFFGKEVPNAIAITANEGMRALEQQIVSVPDSVFPGTLAFGSGNEWDYRDRKFYSEPPINNDALYVRRNDVRTTPVDFTQWLAGDTIQSAVWEVDTTAVTIANIDTGDSITQAQLTFNAIGGYNVCVTATKTNGDKDTQRINIIIEECDIYQRRFIN